MKRQIILAIAKKEFFSFVNSTLAYTVTIPFLFLSIFIYTRNVFITGEANLRPYFDLLPWFLLFLAPALSMRSLTDEYKNNTLELIFAHPISELEILVGKLLGLLAFYTCTLFLTLGLPLTVLTYSKADPGQIVGQYIGALFIGASFLAIGLASSAFVKNAVSSFLLSATAGFLLIIIGFDFIALLLPYPFNLFVGEISIINRAENLTRGLLDIRDIVYFLTLIGIALTVGIYKLSERKLVEDKKERRKLKIAFLLIIGISFFVNLLLYSYPLRLDLTANRLFTLSEGTKQTIKNLPDIVNIRVYASRTLPSQMQLILRDIADLLKDYEKLSKKLSVKIVYPDTDLEAAKEAQNAGIREVTFNKISSGKFEAQSGFLGIMIRYGDKVETIPFIADTSDLEYQLTRKIRKITESKEKTIGLYMSGYSQNQIMRQLLETQYKTINLAVDDKDKIRDIAALLVIDDGTVESTASALISNYLNEYKGRVMLLASGVSVNPQILSVNKSQSSIPSFLKDFGITLNNDLVYDLQLNELLSFGQGNTRYLLPYPFWVKALPVDSGFLPTASVRSVSLGWPSSLKIEEKEGISYKKLLTTSEKGGRQESGFNISPQALKTLVPSGKQVLAVSVEKGESRIVVVGSSNLVDDQFMENNRDNFAFFSNAVDWLIADRDLAAIPAKTAGHSVFAFRNSTDLLIAQFGNLFLPPIIVIAFAVFHLRKRKILTQRVYHAKKS